MSVFYAGSYNSRGASHTARGMVASFRRLVIRDRSRGHARPVLLSDHAATLTALAQVHKVAAGSTRREVVPVPRGFLTPAALIAGAPSVDAPLLLPPTGSAPAHLAAVHGGQLIAGPCRAQRGLRPH